MGADGNGGTGVIHLGNAGIGLTARVGQPRTGRVQGARVVKSHLADACGNGVCLKVPNKNFAEIGIVFIQVVKIIGLEEYAQGFGQVVHLEEPAGIANEQHLASPFNEFQDGGDFVGRKPGHRQDHQKSVCLA